MSQRTTTRLAFELAIADLPAFELDLYGQPRYPKGHPKGGQFKPKAGGKGGAAPAGGGNPAQAGTSRLSRAKSAVMGKLRSLAERFGFVKSEAQLESEATAEKLGIKLPEGFVFSKGRAGKIPGFDGDITERNEITEAKGDWEYERTSYPIGTGTNNKTGASALITYSEVSAYNEVDDDDELHYTTGTLARVPYKSLPETKKFQSNLGRVHSYQFSVDDSFDQVTFDSPEMASQIIKAVKADFGRVMGGVKDGEVMTVTAWRKDGNGSGREAAYRRMGFSKANKKGRMFAIRSGDKLYPIEEK